MTTRPRLGFPVQTGTYRITGGFGPRGGTQHQGIDIASVTPGEDYSGAPVFAMEDGLVVEGQERENVSGFGGWVWLRHIVDGQTVDTIYGHMYQRDILVRKGDAVKRGQRIGRVGNNGESSGPHLHFEVWPGGRTSGVAVDPAPWLTLYGGRVTHDGTQPPYDPEKENYIVSGKYETVGERDVEPKAKAAGLGGGAGAIASAFLIYLVDELFYDGDGVQPDVPLPVSGLIGLVVTSAAAFVSSYYARHVNRV